jgi:hypothetical protein
MNMMNFLVEEVTLNEFTAPDTIPVDPSYHGPRIHLPIQKSHFEALIFAFQRGEVR